MFKLLIAAMFGTFIWAASALANPVAQQVTYAYRLTQPHLQPCYGNLPVDTLCEALHVRTQNRQIASIAITKRLKALGVRGADVATLAEWFVGKLWLHQRSHPGSEMSIILTAQLQPANPQDASAAINAPQSTHPFGFVTLLQLEGRLIQGRYILEKALRSTTAPLEKSRLFEGETTFGS